MKNKNLLRAMSLADEKYVAEANPRAMRKRPSWQRWTALAACICLLVTALNLVLFVPYDTTPPDVSRYENSEYYSVIQSINALTFQKPKYKNNFQTLWNTIASIGRGLIMEDKAPGDAGDAENTIGEDIGQSYEEVTDNQVAGVIEGDIFKRSDKYIYYMSDSNLHVYTINKEHSEHIFSCSLDRSKEEINGYYYTRDFEMYLSTDCTTLTVIMPFYSMNQGGWARSLVDIVSIDVTDLANVDVKEEDRVVKEISRVTVTGDYLSSRVVDGRLMLMTNMYVRNPDFSDESTFLPQINSGNGFVSIAPENIMLPEELSSPRYTTVFLLDEKTLEVKGDAAFLSYSQEVYVSRDSIYATSQYTEKTEQNYGYTKTEVKTEIARLSYENNTLTPMGKTTVSGGVKNQYSLDEYEGVLRVVTTTRTSTAKYQTTPDGNSVSMQTGNQNSGIGTALYCIDINTWELLAEVKNFAPKGETVESVRFDGDKAYVCTAVVVTLTDPVFFFDLSDLDNITYKDTGVIDGYSSSLVNWGDGYLLGIGFNDRSELKIEVYEEGESGVNSVTSYELPAGFSQDYKAYFIDRENQLIGLGVTDYTNDYGIEESPERYIVLHFDDFQLREVLNVGIGAYPDYCRATLIDGYMYILGGNSFEAVELWQQK